MNIPCEQCPVLAVCRHKRIIECNILWRSTNLSHKDIFKRAKTVLPRMEGIMSDNLIVTAKHPHYHMKEEIYKKWYPVKDA